MCYSPIKVGEMYHLSTNVYDGRVYDFKTCAGCEDDGIVTEVHSWAGNADEGVTYDDAWEWAHEYVRSPGELLGPIARRWLSRNGCDCETCEDRAAREADRVR